MEINEINKQLYESAFIQNGEYGYHDNNTWNPSINEHEIETMCCGDDENMFYVVGGDNHLYYVEYVKEGITIIN